MRLLINNLATKTNTTVNDEATSFPVENQYSNILVEKTYITDYEDIDLGVATLINSFSLIYSEIGSTPVITLYGASTFGGSDYSLVITDKVHFINQTWRYWRIESDVPIYINYAYLGNYFQFPGVMNSPTPMENNTDSISISNSSQIYSTEGDLFKEVTIDIAYSDRDEYEDFIAWYRTSDRKNNHMLVMFEDSMDSIIYEPFFAKLIGGIEPSRDIVVYEYSLNFREGK